MNRRLHRVLDEIQRTEKKIAEWQEHLKELKLLAEQLENQEIVKTIRSMKLDSRRMLELLEGIQEGTVALPFPDMEESISEDSISNSKESGTDGLERADTREMAQEAAPESEVKDNAET